jgi:hypothetical protein
LSTEDESPKEYGARLRREILERFPSLMDFSRSSGIPYSTLQSYLRGERTPSKGAKYGIDAAITARKIDLGQVEELARFKRLEPQSPSRDVRVQSFISAISYTWMELDERAKSKLIKKLWAALGGH